MLIFCSIILGIMISITSFPNKILGNRAAIRCLGQSIATLRPVCFCKDVKKRQFEIKETYLRATFFYVCINGYARVYTCVCAIMRAYFACVRVRERVRVYVCEYVYEYVWVPIVFLSRVTFRKLTNIIDAKLRKYLIKLLLVHIK